jgi:hypothetical protein
MLEVFDVLQKNIGEPEERPRTPALDFAQAAVFVTEGNVS